LSLAVLMKALAGVRQRMPGRPALPPQTATVMPQETPLYRALRRTAVIGCLALLLLPLTGCVHRPAASFTFVQMADPQLGFGGYNEDVARFRQAVKQINELKPDFVVICGDLVNGAGQKSYADFNAIKATFAVPCYCAPGNHDVSNKPTPKTLERYRQWVGKDYYSFTHEGCVFVIVNSELWQVPVAGESEKQDAWLKQTLEASAKGRHRIFIIDHHPLFKKQPDEADEYFNLPKAKRQELLALFRRCGVVAVLSGHTHTTILKDYEGIQMVICGATSRNFEKQPLGFRLWHVGPDRPYANEFIPLQ
jgi:serine/threonine-protein phosphatase CPPED1